MICRDPSGKKWFGSLWKSEGEVIRGWSARAHRAKFAYGTRARVANRHIFACVSPACAGDGGLYQSSPSTLSPQSLVWSQSLHRFVVSVLLRFNYIICSSLHIQLTISLIRLFLHHKGTKKFSEKFGDWKIFVPMLEKRVHGGPRIFKMFVKNIRRIFLARNYVSWHLKS